MRSRFARMFTRKSRIASPVVLLGLASAAVLLGSPAHAAGSHQYVAQDSPFEPLSTPVGLTAVGLGVIGMVTGALRRKKEIQPENQRKG